MELLNYICDKKKYRTVIAYKHYFEEFLEAQEQKVQLKILQTLRIIEEVELVPILYLKHIEATDGLYEIRVFFGRKALRVFCFFDGNKLIVLLSGFQKKKHKTPRIEIERALRLKDEYYKEKETTK